jgi:hypothetical protein
LKLGYGNRMLGVSGQLKEIGLVSRKRLWGRRLVEI